jgi:hypothetical protein
VAFVFSCFHIFLRILIPPFIVNTLPTSIPEEEDVEGRRSVDLEALPRTRNGGYQLLPDDHVS